MTAELAVYFLRQENLRRRVEFQLVSQCAPFLKGLRIASMMQLPEKGAELLGEALDVCSVMWMVLRQEKEKQLIYLYREQDLKSYLNRPECRKILQENGYLSEGKRNLQIPELLEELKLRMERSRADGAFPHETGIFLGYPAADVEGFIRNNGRGFRFSQYWKVYGDPVAARLLFEKYDRARAHAVNEFLTGASVREIMDSGFVDKTFI